MEFLRKIAVVLLVSWVIMCIIKYLIGEVPLSFILLSVTMGYLIDGYIKNLFK